MSGRSMILLVEDDENDAQLSLRALERHNVANEIVVARDGQEALDFLFGEGRWKGRDLTDQPQVVLLDLNMPKMNGLDVLRRIRTDPRTRLLPVVILTSSKEEQDLLRGYSLGANSYVQKPVDFNKFMEATKQLSLYWMVLNEAPPPSP